MQRSAVVQRAGWRSCAFGVLWLVFAVGAALAQKGADPGRGASKAQACASCHGSAGQAEQPAVPRLHGQQHEFLVLQMFYLREGLRDVPQMAGMLRGYSDRDLEDVAAYYARQPAAPAAPSKDSALHARGAKLAREMGCGGCHLDDFRGQQHVPRIVHQREDYLVMALKAYRDNKRTGTDTSMNAAMYQASDADIAALAHYLGHWQAGPASRGAR